jgi:hypothetical protein
MEMLLILAGIGGFGIGIALLLGIPALLVVGCCILVEMTWRRICGIKGKQ